MHVLYLTTFSFQVGNADVFIPAFKEAQKHGLKLALHLAEVYRGVFI
jgi:hypothetical protein